MVENIIIFKRHTGVSVKDKTLYLGPDLGHYDTIELMDICLDHETLHIILKNLGEEKASRLLDGGIIATLIEDLRVGLEQFIVIPQRWTKKDN